MTLLQERNETVAEAIQEQTYLVIRHQSPPTAPSAPSYVFRVRNEVPGDLADQADAEQGPGRRQAAAAGGGGVNG